ncbi:uncharacterized protein SCODWIG_02929 [Saccharomycodes ludwigii]|uniref:Uncharacterized protein n=1 Tax=Saccharomycodes ludwigii TaxID=36035 RepID=A0A376B905_9ASCO|nr:uncharacterized protein SCODWIG_02929 [Saccharomycodes ludwigii]
MLDPAIRLRKNIIDGNLLIVKRLLRRFPDLLENIDSENGWSSLHYAAFHGRYLVCVHLIQLGHDSQEILKTFKGNTAVHLSIVNGDEQNTHLLLQRFPSCIDMKGDHGWTPVHLACRYNYHKCLELLINVGASLDIRDDVNGDFPLHVAVKYGSLECTKLLIEQGANDKLYNDLSWKPSDVVYSFEFLKSYQKLLKEYKNMMTLNVHNKQQLQNNIDEDNNTGITINMANSTDNTINNNNNNNNNNNILLPPPSSTFSMKGEINSPASNGSLLYSPISLVSNRANNNISKSNNFRLTTPLALQKPTFDTNLNFAVTPINTTFNIVPVSGAEGSNLLSSPQAIINNGTPNGISGAVISNGSINSGNFKKYDLSVATLPLLRTNQTKSDSNTRLSISSVPPNDADESHLNTRINNSRRKFSSSTTSSKSMDFQNMTTLPSNNEQHNTSIDNNNVSQIHLAVNDQQQNYTHEINTYNTTHSTYTPDISVSEDAYKFKKPSLLNIPINRIRRTTTSSSE